MVFNLEKKGSYSRVVTDIDIEYFYKLTNNSFR